MYKGRVQEVLEIAAAPTLEEMRREGQGLPEKLSKLMAYLVDHLFDLNLTASLAWSKAKINDHTLSVVFRDATNLTLAKFIEQRRLEVADRMMRIAPDLGLARIGEAVGYDCYGTFGRAYKRWLCEKPAETRRKPQPPEMDFLYWRRYVCGESDADAAWNVHEIGVRLYPAFEKRLREHYGQAGGEPWLKSDSGRMERLAAEGKWQQLRPLAFDEQKRRVRRVRFHSTALFDLLREKSREEGRRDRQRGVEVAELALISLEGSDEIFGERIHDLRALGWAWLGNAQVLALDFSAADVAFEKADFTWGVVRKHKDPSVVGSLRRFKGALRMYQRDYTEALRLIEESVEVFRREDDNNGKARSLIQRATIYSYTEDWVRSVASFSQAALLLEDQDDSYLAFTVSINLANALAQAGQHGKASKSLSRTRLHYRRIDYPNGAHEIEYVDGFINDCAGDLQAAETLYSVALSGFCKTRARLHVALCSLDLMNLYSRQSRQEKVMELGPEAIASMASLNLHHETVAAMKLLTEALQVGEVSHRVVQGVRVSLQIDPLASLPQ